MQSRSHAMSCQHAAMPCHAVLPVLFSHAMPFAILKCFRHMFTACLPPHATHSTAHKAMSRHTHGMYRHKIFICLSHTIHTKCQTACHVCHACMLFHQPAMPCMQLRCCYPSHYAAPFMLFLPSSVPSFVEESQHHRRYNRRCSSPVALQPSPACF